MLHIYTWVLGISRGRSKLTSQGLSWPHASWPCRQNGTHRMHGGKIYFYRFLNSYYLSLLWNWERRWGGWQTKMTPPQLENFVRTTELFLHSGHENWEVVACFAYYVIQRNDTTKYSICYMIDGMQGDVRGCVKKPTFLLFVWHFRWQQPYILENIVQNFNGIY